MSRAPAPYFHGFALVRVQRGRDTRGDLPGESNLATAWVESFELDFGVFGGVLMTRAYPGR